MKHTKSISTALILALILFTSTTFAKDSKKSKTADPETYLNEIEKKLAVKWPRNKIINVVCHGHSVPAGYFNTPTVDTFNSYPHLLHVALKKRFPHAVINVIVTAIGGENSLSGAKRFEKDVLSLRPDLITIDYSLNDRGAGLAKAKKAWETMIEAAKEKDIKILLLTPTADKRSKLDNPDDALNKHSKQVEGLAKKHQVGLVDSLTAFKKYVKNDGKLNDIMSQINHPNRQGHDLVVKELMKWFPKSFKK